MSYLQLVPAWCHSETGWNPQFPSQMGAQRRPEARDAYSHAIPSVRVSGSLASAVRGTVPPHWDEFANACPELAALGEER